MEFTRRPDLSPQKRIEIAYQTMIWEGVYGKRTQIARQNQISRTFLYQLLNTAASQLEKVFSDNKCPQLKKDFYQLNKMALLLRLEGRCSLQSISSILAESGQSPNSVGYFSELFKSYGSLLPSTLSMESEKFVFYLSDEIFAINTPILVTIDAQSTAILKIELASDRSADSWKAHFEDIEDHLFVTLGMSSDRGLGLIYGYKAAHKMAIWVTDNFHEFRDLYKLLNKLEKKAKLSAVKKVEAARKFDNAKSEKNLEKRLNQYEEAYKSYKGDFCIYNQLSYLTQELRVLLQLCPPSQGIKYQSDVKSELEVILELLGEIDHNDIEDVINSLKNHIDDILVPFGQLDIIHDELLEKIERERLEYLYAAWHHDHFFFQTKSDQKHYHQDEREFWFELAEGILGEDFHEIKDLVFEKLDSVIRASSLVEMVNSIIRPYLNNSKGQLTQETLNLVMFYHNHRRYKSGKRKNKAPIELLMGIELEDHWSDLLIEEARQNVQLDLKPQSISEKLAMLEQESTELNVQLAKTA